jgi:hypothetical protein
MAAYKFVSLEKTPVFLDSQLKLLVGGQGVYMFKNKDKLLPCSFFFYNKDQSDGLRVQFTSSSVLVHKISDNIQYLDKNNKSGLSNHNDAYYWFSLDAQNQQLYAGVGEARLETMTYEYKLTHDDKLFLESLVDVRISLESTGIKPIRLLRDPITNTVPLWIKNTDELTMTDIAKANYMPKANLSSISQKLYDCMSGKNFILDDEDFPDFSKAIEYSIKTPHMWCHKKLKEKSTEFNKDKPNILETYLRITLGENNGESPGIPYVMEIWPVGHFSPIHNHAGASAVIRVLHGKINVKLFPFLCGEKDGVDIFAEAQFKEGDITWISPTLNQTHQLNNLDENDDTCVTIQCYMYENTDSSHYDYFDYLDENGKILQYEPDSDMDFLSFKKKMKEEWENRVDDQSDSLLTDVCCF